MTHAVLYRWRLKDGREADFAAAWARHAETLCADAGCLATRLHKAADGTYLAYSYWPSKDAWRAAQDDPPKSAARSLMAAAVAERLPEEHLEILDERVSDGF